jgi:hypothetical protein
MIYIINSKKIKLKKEKLIIKNLIKLTKTVCTSLFKDYETE